MAKEYHVSVKGNDWAEGNCTAPFRTISKAAGLAMAGDTITVHAGTYRECVSPENGGQGELDRIVYQAAPGEKVIVKGSEVVDRWENVEGTVWKAVLPNTRFGDYNPYAEVLGGDWFVCPEEYPLHTGQVYLNGKAFYEAKTLDEVRTAPIRKMGVYPAWNKNPAPLPHPEDTIYRWYSEVDADATTIYANFQGADPNKELTEINVRKCCFYPQKTGRNYITVRGFEMAQAACPWTPPTVDQPGMLGAHWSKGWIIENNILHDAKCSAISIGKEETTGDNLCTRTHRKPGYQYQMEAVFRARHIGWSKETIGSHIIRNNTIYDCGQNGIVGHMGGVFSQIYNNHIYNIAVRHEFFGYEIAGIKLHAAIDVQIMHNNIHDCTLGTWLDWQAQGTRVSGNIYYDNDSDLMVEVSHGPYLVDNNIFASAHNFDIVSQGGAFVHNLCCGAMWRTPCLDRSTPYHFPHTTEVAGSTIVQGGDDRLYQNVFLGIDGTEEDKSRTGTGGYNGCPVSLEEYKERVLGHGVGDAEIFALEKQPACINNNAYYRDAPAFDREESGYSTTADPKVKLVAEGGKTFLEMDVEEGQLVLPTEIITTAKLGTTRIRVWG